MKPGGQPSAQEYLDIAGVMIVIIDRDERVSLANRKACEVLATTEEAIVGSNWFDSFLASNERDTVRSVFRELMVGRLEPVEYFENCVIAHDGSERFIAWHNTLIHDLSGKIAGTLSSGEDITERRRIHEALQLSESRYQDLYESAPVPYLSCGVDGLIKRVNRATEELTGYDRSELLGMAVLKLYDEESHEKALRLFARFRAGESFENEEILYRRKDGTPFYGLLSIR